MANVATRYNDRNNQFEARRRGMRDFLLGVVFNVCVAIAYKELSDSSSISDFVTIRGVMTVVFMAIVLAFLPTDFRPVFSHGKLILLRGVLTFVTWYGVIFATSVLTLAEAQSVIYADALFVPIIACLFLSKEKKLNWLEMSAICVGFCGVLGICVPTIIETGISDDVLGWSMGLIGVIAYASNHVIDRKLESELNVRFDVRLSIFIGGVVVTAMGFCTKAAEVLFCVGCDSWSSFSGLWGVDERDLLFLAVSTAFSLIAAWFKCRGNVVAKDRATACGLAALPLGLVLGTFISGKVPELHVVVSGCVVLGALVALALMGENSQDRKSKSFGPEQDT